MTAASDRPTLREDLLHEHEAIDLALDHLVAAFESGDRDIARAAFRELDARLSAHLALEEEVLPEFAELEPAQAAQLEREHHTIRAALDELGIGTDLHLTRVPAIRALAEMLRAHARREDALFYRWIETQPWPRATDRASPEPAATPRPL